MDASDRDRWSRQDAQLLAMVSTNLGPLTLGPLLRRCDLLFSLPPWESFMQSMNRLLGAGLVIWSAERFFISSEGRAISPRATGPRYFKDLFAEVHAALNEHVPEPTPVALPVSAEQFEAALAYVEAVKERQRTRSGLWGNDKWNEWTAPPLRFADCVEFLSFIEGRHVFLSDSTQARGVTFRGTVGPPLPSTSAQDSMIFPLRSQETEIPDKQLELGPDSLTTASYSSFDGVDYFTLKLNFADGSAVTLTDANK